MKKLPADFPKPPAESEGLKAAIAWILQVLTWFLARAAAGELGFLDEETDQTGGAAERRGALARTGSSDRDEAGRRSDHEDAATESEARAARPAPIRLGTAEPLGLEIPGGNTVAEAGAAPPPAARPTIARPSQGRQARQHRREARPMSGVVPQRRPSADLHPRPTTGPPPKTRVYAAHDSHAYFVTIS